MAKNIALNLLNILSDVEVCLDKANRHSAGKASSAEVLLTELVMYQTQLSADMADSLACIADELVKHNLREDAKYQHSISAKRANV